MRLSDQVVISISEVTKSFDKDDRRIYAIRNLNLEIYAGSFVAIVGRSGCGKSTLLNMIAGLSLPTAGSIAYRERPITGPVPDMGYLTQQDTLMPWRGVRRNIELPLEIQGVKKEERTRRAADLIGRVSLQGFEDHFPHELSGGMRRRASLARMLSSDPHTLLLDEPFGALDAQLRRELQAELVSLWHGTGKTVVFVTHDLDEALCLADRVVTLGRGGKVLLDRAVDLPRPRDLELIRLDPKYVEAHRTINEALKEGAIVRA